MDIIQQPDTLSFAGNIKDIIVKTNTDISFSLAVSGLKIVDEVYTPLGGKVVITLKNIVNRYLKLSVPDYDIPVQEQVEAMKQFTATVGAEPISFTVIKGGVDGVINCSAFLTGNFLTWQPQQKNVILRQAEWLTYYAAASCLLLVKAYFVDKTTATHTIALPAGKVTSVNTCYDTVNNYFPSPVSYYDIWVEADGNRLTYVQRYIPVPEADNAEIYLFENTLGGLDSFVCTGSLIEKIKTEGVLTTQYEITSDSSVDLSISYEQNTGYLRNRDEAKWLRDFFASEQRYHLADGIRKIYIEEQDNKFKISDLNAFTFEFFYCNQTFYNKVVRNRESLPELLEFPDTAGLFFLTPRLSEYPVASYSEELMLPVQHPFSSAWQHISISEIVRTSGGPGTPGSSEYWSKEELIVEGLYLKYLENKIKAGYADKSGDSVLWDKNKFADLIDQAVRTTDDVEFNSLTTNQVSTPNFISGFLGSGTRLKNDHLELDEITVRKRMTVHELLIDKIKSIGGTLILSVGNCKITEVTDGGTYFKCSFDNDSGNIENPFVEGDLVLCQTFTGNNIKRYWRRVTSVGVDYFNLSKSDCETDSASPQTGDECVQLGNRTDTSRQSAMILCAVGPDAPYIDQYVGINSFSLVNKLISREGNLSGIVDDALGQLTGSGLYSKNAYLRGKLALSSGKEVETAVNETSAKADNAQSTAESAQQQANTANAGLTKVTQDVQLLADAQNGFNLKVSTVEEKIDSLQIGGVNLINSSKGTFEVNSERYWDRREYEPMTPGKTYLFHADSCKINGVDNNNVTIIISDGDYVGALFYQLNIPFVATKNYKYVAITNNGDGRVISIENIMLEAGNKASAWSPSLADQQAQIDNIRTGVRNLLLKSNIPATNSGYLVKKYIYSEQLIEGEIYTIVFSGRTNGPGELAFYQDSGWVDIVHIPANTTTDTVVTKTFICRKHPSATHSGCTIYFVPYGTAGTATVNWAMLVKGNKAPSDWIAAPEDIETKTTELQAQITANRGLIELVATKEEFDTLGNQVGQTIMSKISVLPDNINLIVTSDKLISKINASPEAIRISSAKIEITGQTIFRDGNGNVVQIFGTGNDVFNINNAFCVDKFGKATMMEACIKSNTNGNRVEIDPANRRLLLTTDAGNNRAQFYFQTNGVVFLETKDSNGSVSVLSAGGLSFSNPSTGTSSRLGIEGLTITNGRLFFIGLPFINSSHHLVVHETTRQVGWNW